MKWLYKYPQRAFPYDDLVATNKRRSRLELEYELLDTGVFEGDRYFDVTVEYAKGSPEDVLIRITATNRGPEPAMLVALPTIWFRNTWRVDSAAVRPSLRETRAADGTRLIAASHPELGDRWLYVNGEAPLLFTDNETNTSRIFRQASGDLYVKDGINDFVVGGREAAVNPAHVGTKAAVYGRTVVAPGASTVWWLRLSNSPPETLPKPFADFEAVFATRLREADDFYRGLTPPDATPDQARVVRQALAGMLWTKQYYYFDGTRWLAEHGVEPFTSRQAASRNDKWGHMVNADVISMPDKWEYPWYAAWDLAFHAVALTAVDIDFAKAQLSLMLSEMYLHPSGQIPAYEWNFSDVNPPVHAWATIFLHRNEQALRGHGDITFLKRSFGKLLANFTWWVNRKDRDGRNLFEGGFLGLDNITVIDRSERTNDGSVLEQSDATGWMGMFCLNLMRIALELARENHVYEGLASKFLQHYTYVAYAMKHMGNRNYALFDEKDGFFYDVLRYPDGRFKKFRVRSLVGLIPLFAVERLELDWIEPFKEFTANLHWFITNRREMTDKVIHRVERDGKVTYLLTIVDQEQIKRLLARLHDESEFLSRYGVRSLSKFHEEHPFELDGRTVRYEPAESSSKLKGGNSNWRGPLWFPTSFLIIESLRKLGTAFGPEYALATPGGRGAPMSFRGIAKDLSRRMIDIFLLDENARRPVWGGSERFQRDPHWRDELLFYEYFHGDNGAGIGASHQTGWTALVANLIDEWPKTAK
jgi:hypothetical protein